MATTDLEERVAALEQGLQELRLRLDPPPDTAFRSWLDGAGTFADDPVFDEIVRLGAEYRRSLRPDDGEDDDAHP